MSNVALDKNGVVRFIYREYEKYCVFCGSHFTANHNRAKYCSTSCMQKAAYRRLDETKKREVIRNAAIRSAESFSKKSAADKKAKWDRANKKKSIKNKISKYGTDNDEEIKIIKKEEGRKKVQASRLARSKRPFYKMKSCLYRRLNFFVSGEQKNCHMEEYLGCSFEELRKYLESKFVDGMTWENHTKHGWHIDHIIPCAAFDLTKEDNIRKCFHYTNLQPLWAKENLSKGAKITAPVMSD